MEKNKYVAWASNDSGAVDNSMYSNSKSDLLKRARAIYGSGWTIHIRDIDGSEDIITNRIR